MTTKAKTNTKTSGKARDQFGLLKGSKRSKAAAMFARAGGCTMKEVEKALGQTHYNLLAKLAADGHTVRKAKDGFILVAKK